MKQGIVAAILLGVVAVSCDPAYRWTPEGWRATGPYRWSFENKHLTAVLLAPGGFTGSSDISPEPEITNRSDEPIVFEAATLTTGDRSYRGTVGAGGVIRNRTVAPGETKRVLFSFGFERPLRDALGRTFLMTVEYRVGGQPETLLIRFKRNR